MSEIRKCRAAEIFDDPAGPGLIAEYAEECAIALIGKPAPRRETYEGMERSGMAQCFAAYQDGALVGFAMLLVVLVPHYDLALATVESLFVTRRASCGTALMDALNLHARDSGCTTIVYSAPVGSRLARMLAMRSNYERTNEVFCRRLA